MNNTKIAEQAQRLDEAIQKDLAKISSLQTGSDEMLLTPFTIKLNLICNDGTTIAGVPVTTNLATLIKEDQGVSSIKDINIDDFIVQLQEKSGSSQLFRNTIAFLISLGQTYDEALANVEKINPLKAQQKNEYIFKAKDVEICRILEDGNFVWHPDVRKIMQDDAAWALEDRASRFAVAALMRGQESRNYVKIEKKQRFFSKEMEDGIYALIRVGDV